MQFESNPARDLASVWLEIVALWRTCRPQPGIIRGMAAGYIPSAPVLPEAGGVLDQGAWLHHAMDVLDMAETQRRNERLK